MSTNTFILDYYGDNYQSLSKEREERNTTTGLVLRVHGLGAEKTGQLAAIQFAKRAKTILL